MDAGFLGELGTLINLTNKNPRSGDTPAQAALIAGGRI